MASFRSLAFTDVGVAESARLKRWTSAAACAARGMSTVRARAKAARAADRGRNNGTSVGLGAGAQGRGAPGGEGDPVEAWQHSRQSEAPQPLGGPETPPPP